ncbi:MAG TPA: carbohydrate kinase family protein [Anaerolineales bacterium]
MQENSRHGILAGGNWIVDLVKVIDVYPSQERLANILSESLSHGGAPFNVLKALNKMAFDFPLEGIGVIGDDEKGQEILRQCYQRNIDVGQIKILQGESTSYTDVMTVASSGVRTFFHYRGANALLDETFFNFSNTRAKVFHLGYLLLLDGLDRVNGDGLTGASRVLRSARESGLITSADVVSEQSDRYARIIPPALRFTDVLFINDFETRMLTGKEVVNDQGVFQPKEGFAAADSILEMGVQQWVVIHFPKGVLAASCKGERIFQETLRIPPSAIKGTVGAGDAFAAGVLGGIHEGWNIRDCLVLGVSAAAASLMDETASEGIKPWKECLELVRKFGFN